MIRYPPQDLALMAVRKAINMARALSVPVLALTENMSYVACSHCGEEIHLFGPSRAKEVAETTGIPSVAVLLGDPVLSHLWDTGRLAEYEAPGISYLASQLLALLLLDELSGGQQEFFSGWRTHNLKPHRAQEVGWPEPARFGS